MPGPATFLGIDLGTSSVRCCAVNSESELLALSKVDLPRPISTESGWFEQDPAHWWQASLQGLHRLGGQIALDNVKAVSVDGTSSTVFLTGSDNRPVSTALMYNDSRGAQILDRVDAVIPPRHLTRSATSSLLKSLWLLQHSGDPGARITHQADWILARLTGISGVSDENNCLKLGYDSIQKRWPEWMHQLPWGFARKLPVVHRPSDFAGPVCPLASQQTGLPADTLVFFGTTDSTASTLATGADREGQAVTTLGTTMVMKTITAGAVNSFDYGIYSQRLPGNLWLAGGASNAGGNVLQQFFSIEQIESLSRQIDVSKSTGLDYYPLVTAGERFPVNDPALQPRLAPRPASDVLFLAAIFEGLANIERLAYEKIAEYGGGRPGEIITSGGKAAGNAAYRAIRQRILGIPVTTAKHTEASYGMALLAKRGWEKHKKKAG